MAGVWNEGFYAFSRGLTCMETVSASPIHPPAGAVLACQKCGECCRRYAISALPHELERQAKFFKMGEKEFIGVYGRILLQFLPFSSSDHPLAMHVSMIPKSTYEQLKKNGFEGDYAMMLPMIGFKKQEYCVFFNPKTFGCTMHLVKPMQCTLFPFTSLKDNEDYSKAYDFCEQSRILSPTEKTKEIQSFHRKEWKTFFDKVALKGLKGGFDHWPAEGDVIHNGKIIGKITLPNLHTLIELARTKDAKKD